jgi:DNA repair exonuclease SbcCD ATPase subunit
MKLQTERTGVSKTISSLKNELLREISSSNSKIQDEIEVLRVMTGAHNNMIEEKEELINTLERYEIISAILGDNGVKRTIIKQYLPAVNTLMNSYLRDLNFNAKFSIDEEFNEKIIIRGMETTYSCLSEGERQKIDLCSVLAWREASQLRARFTTNLFVADEILDGNLDSGSKESFMEILKNLPDKNIFIITHDHSYSSFFDSQISVEKKANGFSSLMRT